MREECLPSQRRSRAFSKAPPGTHVHDEARKSLWRMRESIKLMTDAAARRGDYARNSELSKLLCELHLAFYYSRVARI